MPIVEVREGYFAKDTGGEVRVQRKKVLLTRSTHKSLSQKKKINLKKVNVKLLNWKKFTVGLLEGRALSLKECP